MQHTDSISSLLFITPGFFWNDRFRSVIDSVKLSIDRLVDSFSLTPDRDEAFAPVPLNETDFTDSEYWLDYIRNDEHKTTALSMKSVFIMDEIQELSWGAIRNIKLPMYVILANKDRIVDNRKVKEYLTPLFSSSSVNQMTQLDTAHAMQFEQPDELAQRLCAFVLSLEEKVQST